MTSRWEAARRLGKPLPWVDEVEDAIAHEAERMVARWLGVPTFDYVGAADPGWDMVYRGWRIDTKWTRYRPPWLKCRSSEPLLADIYCVVVGSSIDDLWIPARCWAIRSEVMAAPLDDFGQERAGAYTLRHLRPAEFLKGIVPRPGYDA